MSQEVSNEQAIEERLQTFIETVKDSETYEEFVAANERLEADSEARALLEEYQQKKRQLQRGGSDDATMSELRELRTELDDNEIIQAHQAAQEAFVSLLQETNDVISEQIGREFAQSLGGGCC
ncbi:halo-CC-star protein HcsL [Halomicrobium katesii]|uniref:halo-CC-star protein HcsL n=1 Tax=Halomicrobium katesii TaxID=437163 RepID=UPI00035D02C5|nr:halo-CC-star protein HcsL [Halomicrobium katesii]